MMMDKRLLGMVPDSKKFIAGNVACQWISMVANAALAIPASPLREELPWLLWWCGGLPCGPPPA